MNSNSVVKEVTTGTINAVDSRTGSQPQARFVAPEKGRFLDLFLALFVALLLMSNIAATKLIGLELPGVPGAGGSFFSLVFDGGAVMFPFTYILGDVSSEVYGFRGACRAVLVGFAVSALTSVLFHLVVTAPPGPGDANHQAFQAIFGFAPRVVAASLVGYVVGQLLSAPILVGMKGRTGEHFLWGRMIASTLVGELVDTVLFCTVAFAGVISGTDFWSYVVTGYIYKCGLGIATSSLSIQVIRLVKYGECSYLPMSDAMPVMSGSVEISDSWGDSRNTNAKFETCVRLGTLGRAEVIRTPHGDIPTPAFIPIGIKATVRALAPEQVRDLGASAVLANAYHLYLQPGPELVDRTGGFGASMNWDGPTFTDSGGFQILNPGVGYKKVLSQEFAGKVKSGGNLDSGMAPYEPADPGNRHDRFGQKRNELEEFEENAQLAEPNRNKVHPGSARVDEDSVNFRSHLDGTHHHFSPEISMQTQHLLGTGIIFASDELTSLLHSYNYQMESLERIRRWAERCLREHRRLIEVCEGKPYQMLLGVIQGAQWEDLHHKAARDLGLMCVDGRIFDGSDTGGVLEKENLGRIYAWVAEELPEDRPRHLLGISEPEDFFTGIEAGADTFGCVSLSRVTRNGAAYLETGRINMSRTAFREDFSPVQSSCGCYMYRDYTHAYIHYLLKAKEILASTLLIIHNEYYTMRMVQNIHAAILAGGDTYREFKQETLDKLGRL